MLREAHGNLRVSAWIDGGLRAVARPNATIIEDRRRARLLNIKPATSKGVYLKKLTLSSTMGPGVTVDQSSLGL